MRRINSDELGDKGENRFQEMCSDARVTCNKASRDRTGWDYLVELPPDDHPSVPLDRRGPAWTCYVQVKTVWDDNHTISVNLKMAERLAKNPNPSFIIALKVDDDLKFTAAYLLDMSGEHLAKILKRLREEELAGNRASLTKKKIQFKLQEDERIAVSGTAVLETMKSKFGDDVFSHFQARAREQREIGYEARPIEVKTTLPATDIDKLLDVFLGVEELFPVDEFKITETRFGIPMTRPTSPTAKITITPTPIDCVVAIVDPKTRDSVLFEGGVIRTPEVVTGRGRVHIRFAAFTLSLDFFPDAPPTCVLLPDFSGRYSPTLWNNIWTALKLMRRGPIRVRVAQKGSPAIETTIENRDGHNIPSSHDLERWLTITNALAQICREASLVPEPSFSFPQLGEAEGSILTLKALMDGINPALNVNENVTDQAWTVLQSIERLIAAHRFVVGEICCAYYYVGTLPKDIQPQTAPIGFEAYDLRRIESIDSDPKAFSGFIEDAQSVEGIEHILTE